MRICENFQKSSRPYNYQVDDNQVRPLTKVFMEKGQGRLQAVRDGDEDNAPKGCLDDEPTFERWMDNSFGCEKPLWVIYLARFLFYLIFWIFFVGQLRVISLCRFWPKCPCGLMVRPRTCQYCKPAIPRGFFVQHNQYAAFLLLKKITCITNSPVEA